MMKCNLKKKGLLLIVVLCISLFAIPVVFAEESKMTITFDSNGGSEIDAKEVSCDDIGELPSPSMDGHSFTGWTLDGKEFKVGETEIECKDITLKATWSDDCDAKCQACNKFKRDKLTNYSDKYGFKVEYDTDNRKFTLSMSGNKDWSKRVFYISRVAFYDIDQATQKTGKLRTVISRKDLATNFGLKPDKDGYVKLWDGQSVKLSNPLTQITRIKIRMSPTYGWADPEVKEACGDDATFYVDVTYDYFGDAQMITDGSGIDFPDPGQSQGKIDCTKTFADNSFEKHYCDDLAAAKKALGENGAISFNDYVTKYNAQGNTKTFYELTGWQPKEFKCDPKKQLANDNPTPLATDKNATNYYENKSYLWGTVSFEHEAGQYEYHYGGQKVLKDLSKTELVSFGVRVGACSVSSCSDMEKAKLLEAIKAKGYNDYSPTGIALGHTVTEAIKCKISCDEVVTVEYGPPVASKAGLCFGYKVKVTSRVNCSSDPPSPPSKKDQGYCMPTPGCNHGSGYADNGAGPNDEFDSCINSCDGGKYTSKCSVKCYEKIYKQAGLSKTSVSFGDLVATQLNRNRGNNTVEKDADAKECKGYYRHANKGEVIEINGEKITTNIYGGTVIWIPETSFGRWYCYNSYNNFAHPCLKTYAEGGGLSSVCNCGAKCRWNGCSGDKYLNPGESKIDDQLNLEAYETALESCKSFARCSTATAEYSFDVSYYEKGKSTPTDVHFPYDKPNSGDTITYNSANKTVTCDKAPGEKNGSLILDSAGCYKCGEVGANENDNSKSSNRSYMTEWTFPGVWMHNKTGEISYEDKKEQSSWKFMDKKFCLSLNVANVNTKWYSAYYIAKYNGNASISYFNGDPDDKNKCVLTNCETKTWTNEDDKTLEYNIHGRARKFGLFGWNIDASCFYAVNENFPDSETTCKKSPGCEQGDAYKIRSVDLGNIFPSESGEKIPSPETIGRSSAPFNWSPEASTATKVPEYQSQPGAYTTWLQQNGYKIYQGDDYLDYDITLTKDDIKNLRRKYNEEGKGQNYTKFEGEILEDHVYAYKSDLFRGGIIKNAHVPDPSVLGCNNIKNYNSKECYVIGGEED